MSFSTIFGIANGCAGLTPSGMRCTVTVWIVLLTLQISTFLLFSVALNLQLVLVHGINGQRMEKWYYICSVSLALGLTIPPLAAKQYGYDSLTDACWYSNSNNNQRLIWQISTQIFWSVACAFGELVAFIIVLVHMLRHQASFPPPCSCLHYTKRIPPGLTRSCTIALDVNGNTLPCNFCRRSGRSQATSERIPGRHSEDCALPTRVVDNQQHHGCMRFIRLSIERHQLGDSISNPSLERFLLWRSVHRLRATGRNRSCSDPGTEIALARCIEQDRCLLE
ncbi:hypothetical protein CYLTODRAFT_486382 [Cylindrobasidium torrendii FP15055 ss-10]|uniref:G-protein coupled receptors family 2 profile 2 domain-containing protein n=1 Tax=Cylindrobasidium torrendii FP15055 ss-10 TaxID=1314674 RepID=A0A0D7BPK7_9AGAR|nr:hypothetical protein CYLTODRAFT_486382 [Cylindrobasidium torrendii FP15055 ss-10]